MKRNKLEWMVAGVLMLAGMALCAHAQDTKDTLFAGTDVFEKGATSVTDINMGPDGLGMVTGRRAADAHRMMLNTVKTYEYDQPGLFNMADVDKFRQKLNSGDWSCSIHERNLKTGESTDVCSKHRSDGYRESAIITVEKKELTFIHRIEKENPDGHSDVVFGPALSGLSTMPAMMALNSGKLDAQMAVLQAKLSVGLMGMHGPLMVIPDGSSSYEIDPKDAQILDGLKDQWKTMDGSPKSKPRFIIKNFSGPKSPDAPVGTEAPAPPAPDAPGTPQP